MYSNRIGECIKLTLSHQKGGEWFYRFNLKVTERIYTILSLTWISYVLTEFNVWETQNITCTRAWLTIYLTASGPTEQAISCC